MAAEILGSVRALLGESPLWHDGSLYWTDVNRGHVHCLGSDGRCMTWRFDEPAVAIRATRDSNRLLLVLGGSLVLWSPKEDARLPLARPEIDWPRRRFNDATIDAGGRLWVGSMRNNIAPDGAHMETTDRDGQIHCFSGADMVATPVGDLGCPNGLCLSPDGKTLYWADSAQNRIWSAPIGTAGMALGEPCLFNDGFVRGIPDGSAVDAQGFVWNARFGGGCVVRFAPDGRIDKVIDLPVTNPTSCCLGGPDWRTLFVTSAALFAPPSEDQAGGTLAFDVGASASISRGFVAPYLITQEAIHDAILAG